MIILYDDARARTFEPFATTRPVGELRAGAFLGRERWGWWFGAPIDGCVVAPHLAAFDEFDSPPVIHTDLAAGTWLVNARALPSLTREHVAPAADPTQAVAHILRIDGRIAAVRLASAVSAAQLHDGMLTLEALAPLGAPDVSVAGRWLDDAWDLVRFLPAQLAEDVPFLARQIAARPLATDGGAAGPVILGGGTVFVEAGARIEPLVVFDTQAGDVLVRAGASVQAFTRIVGPCFIGRDTAVMGGRITASSIGDMCRVHGELSTSVFIGHANKGHDGFVGHSLLGRWVNLGAGTITSNLKNTYGTVAMWTTEGIRDSGLQFAGTFFGDHVKTGIGLRLTTGCVLGAGANVMDTMPPKAVAPFAWGTRAPYGVFDAAKFTTIAARVMGRRQVTLSEPQRAHLTIVMQHALADVRWPAR